LRTEELKGSFDRAKMEYLQGLHDVRAAKIEDPTREPAHDTALERAIDAERQRGIPEDFLEDVERALQLWREKMVAQIKEERRLKKLAREEGSDGL